MKIKEVALILLLIALLFFISGCFYRIGDEETNQYVNLKNGFEDVENFRKAAATGPRKAVGDCILRGNCRLSLSTIAGLNFEHLYFTEFKIGNLKALESKVLVNSFS